MAATGSAAPTVVASGVAEALITTAAGLVVAVPALVLYNYFAGRLNVMLTVAENNARLIHGALMGDEDPEEESNTKTETRSGDKRTGKSAPNTRTPEPAVTR
jgi:biopolymer transport protein ExbB